MILVTGATGHIGNVLVRELLARKQKVRALIWRGEDTIPLRGLNAEQVEGDLLDPSSLAAALRSVTKVFHLAGLISIMPGAEALLHRVNVEGTRNLLAEAIRAGVRRFVYTSSIHALRDVPGSACIDESVPFDAQQASGPYGRTKAEATLDVLRAAHEGLDAVVACPTGVIGPYDFRRSEIGSVIMDAAAGRLMPYIDGDYDFADVRDVAHGLILSAERGRRGEAYILSGERISVRYILESVFRGTGRAFARVRIPFGLARLVSLFTPYYYRLTGAKPRFTPLSLDVLQSNSHISHAKATRELGYQPRPMRESISDAARWFLENRSLFSRARPA